MKKALHRELYSPEREEIEKRAEYFELETRRHEKLATVAAVALGVFLGASFVTLILGAIAVSL